MTQVHNQQVNSSFLASPSVHFIQNVAVLLLSWWMVKNNLQETSLQAVSVTKVSTEVEGASAYVHLHLRTHPETKA